MTARTMTGFKIALRDTAMLFQNLRGDGLKKRPYVNTMSTYSVFP